MKRALFTTAALALGLAIAVPVAAQQFGPGGGGRMMHGGWGGNGAGFARMCENQDARMAGMLAYAETRLKITDAQKPAWTKFTEAAKAGHQPMAKLCADLKDKPLPTTLPERVERMRSMTAARLAQMDQALPALKDLYTQLTPEQKQVADSLMNHGRWGGGGPGQGPGAGRGMGPGMGPGQGPGMGPGMGPGGPGQGPGQGPRGG